MSFLEQAEVRRAQRQSFLKSDLASLVTRVKHLEAENESLRRKIGKAKRVRKGITRYMRQLKERCVKLSEELDA